MLNEDLTVGLGILAEKFKKEQKAEEAEKTEAMAEIKHVIVPRHEILSESGAKELIEGLKLKPEQLPKISASDPAIQHLSPKVGDIIRISRNSATAGTATYFRLVIESEETASTEE